MLLLDGSRLTERRRAVEGPLAPLFDSLSADLAPALGASPYIPSDKALLSRAGGRCEADGATLEFDPASPHVHRCPSCGRLHRGELHHRAWITSYQLWLAERAVHAALFHLLRPDARQASFARNTLLSYAELYLRYPNVDNVLGPTRLFFSTYLESIWLLQICVAADLLASSGDQATADLVIDRIVEPSRALIAEYDEGLSNRQVWNNAALLAAAVLARDDVAFERALHGRSSVARHLSNALLPDGTWYEGDNYHQFAMRGLWYCVTLAESRGAPLDHAHVQRFDRAFSAPYLTALPDFTMPARKDSQYGVSLRQWRIAEFAELGFARTGDSVLGAALCRTYELGHARGDIGRSRSTADVERNMPASALTRADLGWKALLHALPELPDLPAATPRSTLLEEQGYVVLRRAKDVYVGVEFGQSGGGHGHPDRLNLVLSDGRTRWLDDMGTGSYVDPSLHWFRSTLAHNAPLVNGRSQDLHDGQLLAYDEREGLGWIRARYEDGGVQLVRTVVVAPGYLLDDLAWTGDASARVELPWHLDGAADVTLTPARLDGGTAPEDGFAFASAARSAPLPPGQIVRIDASANDQRLRALLTSDVPASIFRAEGPGQPPDARRKFYLLRSESADSTKGGRFRAVLSWSADVERVRFEAGRVAVSLTGSERHVHAATHTGWKVELFAGEARSSIDLEGVRPHVAAAPHLPVSPVPTPLHRTALPRHWLSELSPEQRRSLLLIDVGERHYRRSEASWTEAGQPHATIAVAAREDALVVLATIAAGELRFATPGASNVYDNEHADTMMGGLQLYVRTTRTTGAWMLVPIADSGAMRSREIAGWGGLPLPVGQWRPWGDGYEIRIELPLPDAHREPEYPLDLDLLINETSSGRERRRGQLVASGAPGEWVYLRGDRHEPRRLIPLVILP